MPPTFEIASRRRLLTLVQDDSGQDLTEYAVLIGLIALVVVVAVATLGQVISSVFNDIGSSISGSGVGSGS
ncbi:MAG: Flp family type IVb pilin [Gemmatimonadota bacterium]|nr:Flp family type IVb pilin [Gemmatimonadota bacterium]MDH3426867.1 Flp family type IVb pilin [Gemmatimonadota bacterium]